MQITYFANSLCLKGICKKFYKKRAVYNSSLFCYNISMKSKYVVYVVLVLIVGWVVYWVMSAPKIEESNIVADKGLHWHAHLSINVNGKEIEIPANIGVNGVMGAGGDPMELHTHDKDGIVHAEFAGTVTKDQLALKNFFKVWGQDFSKESVLGNKTDATHHITMTVNGVENNDFENYEITGKGDYDAGALGKVDDIKIIYK